MTHSDAQLEKAWSSRLAPYRRASNARAFVELALTLGLFLASWGLSWAAYTYIGLLASLVMAVPAGALMVRLFILQHDCGHGSLFKSHKINHWVGRVLGVFTMTPYDSWRDSHARHHAGSGNLHTRGFGDIDTMTVNEYEQSNRWEKFKYRLYRHPVVLFGLGPAYMFFLRHRVPLALVTDRTIWVTTMLTNAAIAVAFLIMMYWVGIAAFLWIHLPMVLVGGSIGMWLFYVQHQFDDTLWDAPPDWDRDVAALHGSSYYDLPKPLMWLSGNIGIHHVHHLSSRIPFHQLPKVLRDFPELKKLGRITFWESLSTIRLALWCEKERRLVSFREARLLRTAQNMG
jgi:acyl-lipid omega-6 desaturase (Delta-12 desaturase)